MISKEKIRIKRENWSKTRRRVNLSALTDPSLIIDDRIKIGLRSRESIIFYVPALTDPS